MLHFVFILFRWHCRTSKNKLPVLMPVVYFKTHRIPYLGGYLPFVNKSRCISRQNITYVSINHLPILATPYRIVHIYDTGRSLLRSPCFTTGFRTFQENRTHSVQLVF